MHRPISSSFPSGHAASAFTAAMLLSDSPAAPFWFAPGGRSSPPAGSTRACTTPPTSWPAPRSASRSVRSLAGSCRSGRSLRPLRTTEPSPEIADPAGRVSWGHTAHRTREVHRGPFDRRHLRLPVPLRLQRQRGGGRRPARRERRRLPLRALLARPGARRRRRARDVGPRTVRVGNAACCRCSTASRCATRSPTSSSTPTWRCSRPATTTASSSTTKRCCATRWPSAGLDPDAVAEEAHSGRPLKTLATEHTEAVEQLGGVRGPHLHRGRRVGVRAIHGARTCRRPRAHARTAPVDRLNEFKRTAHRSLTVGQCVGLGGTRPPRRRTPRSPGSRHARCVQPLVEIADVDVQRRRVVGQLHQLPGPRRRRRVGEQVDERDDREDATATGRARRHGRRVEPGGQREQLRRFVGVEHATPRRRRPGSQGRAQPPRTHASARRGSRHAGSTLGRMRALTITADPSTRASRSDPNRSRRRVRWWFAGPRRRAQPRRPRPGRGRVPGPGRFTARHPRSGVRGHRDRGGRARTPSGGLQPDRTWATGCSASPVAGRRPNCSRCPPRSARRCPTRLDLVAAGGVPETFVTAHDAMVTQARARAGRDGAHPRRRIGGRHHRAAARPKRWAAPSSAPPAPPTSSRSAEALGLDHARARARELDPARSGRRDHRRGGARRCGGRAGGRGLLRGRRARRALAGTHRAHQLAGRATGPRSTSGR